MFLIRGSACRALYLMTTGYDIAMSVHGRKCFPCSSLHRNDPVRSPACVFGAGL